MKVQLKLWQKGLIIVALPLVCELIFVTVLSTLLYGVETEARNTERSRNIVVEAEQMERIFFQAGAALASYQASKNPLFLLQYQQARQRISAQLELLDRLCRDNKRQRAQLSEIAGHVEKGLSLLEVYRSRIERDDVTAGSLDKEVANDVMALGGTLGKIVANEKEMEIHRPQAERHLRQLVEQCLFAGIALNVVIAVAISVYFSRGITSRLLILGSNSERLAGKQELLPVMSGTDEIAQLDTVFHRMAETLAEASRKERAVVDNAVDVICSIDAEGRFAACNPAAEKIWGYKISELLERQLESLIEPESREVTRQAFLDAREKKLTLGSPGGATHGIAPTGVFDNRITARDGDLVDMRWSIYWSDSEQRTFCVAHDVSSEKRLERLRKEVLDMVTHDLRTPLASMDLSIDMLQMGHKGALPDEAARELQKIKRSSAHLMQLVNDLLDMEKLKEGKLKLACKRVNLQLIVENAFEAVASVAALRRISLVEKDCDVDLFADGSRILQVLINLLSNALKFAPEESEVIVKADLKGREVTVKVIDCGPGMTEEEAGRLFKRFVQLESHQRQGTGLGLAISRALIDLHGGTTGVISSPGKGSTFWFRLPASEAD